MSFIHHDVGALPLKKLSGPYITGCFTVKAEERVSVIFENYGGNLYKSLSTTKDTFPKEIFPIRCSMKKQLWIVNLVVVKRDCW